MTETNVTFTLGRRPTEGWPIAILFIGDVIVMVAAFLYKDYLRFMLGVLALFFVLIAVASKYKIGPFKTLLVDMFSPVYLAMVTFTFYFYIFLSTYSDVDQATIIYVAASTGVALVFFTILWSAVRPKSKRTAATAIWVVKDGTTIYILSQIIGWITFLFIAWLAGFRSITEIYSKPLVLRIFDTSNGIAYIKLVADFLVFMPIYAQTIKSVSKGRNTRLLYILILSGIVYALGSGSRGELVAIFVDIVIIRHCYGISLKMRTALLLSLFLVPFVAVYGVYRSTQSATGMRIADMIDIANKLGPQKIINEFFSRFDAPLYFNLLMANRNTINLRPTYGLSYLEMPLQAIPRSIWPNKPSLPNAELTSKLVPNAIDVGFDFSIFGETYREFKGAGFLIAGILVASLAFVMQLFYMSVVSSHNPQKIILYVLISLFIVFTIVAGFIPSFITLALSLVQYLCAVKLFFTKVNIYVRENGVIRS